MDTPEPVENARESFGNIEFNVDNSLSHVIVDDEKMEFLYLDNYKGDWILHAYDGNNMLTFSLSENEVEWVYESEVPEKAREAQEKLAEVQDLLDDIWGETGDTTAEEVTKRVIRTREMVKREYL